MNAFRSPRPQGLWRCAQHLVLALAPSLLLALAACSGHDDEPPPPPPPSVGSATLGATGGTVSGPDGVTLSVAANPDATDTTFRIARDSTGAPTLAGMTLLSPIYAVTPHGTSFNTSAVLKLPYDASKAPAGATVVVLRGETDGSWHISPVRSTVAGAAVVDVSGLSWYAIGVCTPGDAGVFGFGIGDCPANHLLKLEYLDGNGSALPVPRDTNGFALPFLPEITVPTDVVLRVTWARPAGVDRVDSVRVSGSAVGNLLLRNVNQQTFTQDLVAHLDPTRTPGAGAAGGTVRRLLASAYYCWRGFIIGRGDNQSVCWSFDTDLAFRLHDTAPDPGLPTIKPQPLSVSVYEGHAATFHVDGQASNTLDVTWERKDLGSSTWAAAQGFPGGGTLNNGGRDLTLAAVQSRADNGALFRAKVSNVSASGKSSAPVTSDEVQLTVSTGGGLPIQWTAQPTLQPANAGETVSLTMTANAVPYATIEVHRVTPAGLDEVVKVCAPAPVAITNTSASLPQNPTTCGWTQGPVAVGDDGMQFYGLARSDVDPAHPLESSRATLTVNPVAMAPSISTQPAPVSLNVGDTALFSVTASGTGALSYQWRYKATGAASAVALTDHAAGASTAGVAGSGSPTLTISNAQAGDAGSYSVVVSNGTAPDATSQDAALTVLPAQAKAWAVAAGKETTCVIKEENHTVACWGRNSTGQIGDGTLTDRWVPTPVAGLTNAYALAVGQNHACALLGDKSVVCWGDNSGGQLGTGNGPSSTHPVAVPGVAGVVALKAGQFHTCALRLAGTVVCWGVNASSVPTDIAGLSGGVALAAGWRHTCAAKSDGTAVCWGWNNYGQLGNGTLVDSTAPTPVQDLTRVTSLAASGNYAHTCAVTAHFLAYCWGLNSWGQLGDGSMTNRSSPTVVPGLTTVLAVTVGNVHTCAMTSDSAAWCWGSNIVGQLGNGGGSTQTTPGVVPGLTDVVDLAAGANHTCVIRADGSLSCWGDNSAGQLGDGTTVNRHTPTPVLF